mgnify:CR=1 FL=1
MLDNEKELVKIRGPQDGIRDKISQIKSGQTNNVEILIKENKFKIEIMDEKVGNEVGLDEG